MPNKISWVENLTVESVSVCVDTTIYSLEALLRVCYIFTDKCYLFLEWANPKTTVRVRLSAKIPDTDISLISGQFCNELINQKVRMDIATETRPIREMIVAQAFAESSIIDVSVSESSYADDPKGIAR